MVSTNILGIRIDIVTREQALDEVMRLAQLDKPSYVVTVNPEQLYDAYYDPAFRRILNESNLNLCDGVGVKLASFLFPPAIKDIVTGSGMLKDILRIAKKENYKVLVLITPKALSSKEKIEWYFGEQLKMSKDLFKVLTMTETPANDDFDTIRTFKPNITLLAYNHIVASNIIQQMNNINVPGVKMNIGGSFDYLLGLRKIPPELFRSSGLEWLYRLVNEPIYRYKRSFKAVILFPLLVLSTKIRLTYSITRE